MTKHEQTSESYAAEASAIYAQLETEYAAFVPNEELITKLEDQWRYTRQMAEDFYYKETISLWN